MKYWIADIEERNGEFEYKQAIIFTAATEAEADKIHEFTSLVGALNAVVVTAEERYNG